MGLAAYGALLRDSQHRRFLLAGGFSFGAPAAFLVILIWAFATLYPSTLPGATGAHFSASALTVLGLSSAIPVLITMVFAGTLADRYNRRRLLLTTNQVSLAATLLFAVVLAWHPESPVAVPGAGVLWPSGFYLPLWAALVLPLWATVMVSATIFRPTFNAAAPRLFASAEYPSANSFVYVLALVVSVPGDLATPWIYQAFGPAWSTIVPFLLFLGTAVFLLGLTANLDQPEGKAHRRFLNEAAEGYRYLWVRQELLQVTLAALAINFLSAVAFVVLGLYVADWLMLGAPIFVGAMIYGSSIGAGLGTVLATRIRFEGRAGRLLAVFALLQGLMVVLLALSHSFWVSLGVFFLFGLFPGMFSIIFLATLQATVPNDRLGRVLAADDVGSYSLVPVGQYIGGLLTFATDVQVTYLVAGAGTMMVGALMFLSRRLGKLAYVPSDRGGSGELESVVPPGAIGIATPATALPEPPGV